MSKNCGNGSALRTLKRMATLVGLFAATAAFAVPDAGSSTPQVAPVATCTINSPSTLNLGEHALFGGNAPQASIIQMMCTKTTPYAIAFDVGTGAGATVAMREMTSGAATARYALYSDTAHSTVWGETLGIDTVGATASGRRRNHMVYGRTGPVGTRAPGVYSDTITVTVTY
jgi:spore coat protein U domain-containing protein, fimbrial subunit CupE1/2/3/6